LHILEQVDVGRLELVWQTLQRQPEWSGISTKVV